MAAAAWSDGWWTSPDGLRLHYRDYPGRTDLPPILCIPGLTRNARDFAATAGRLAGGWRSICLDLRGRGESQPAKDPMSYTPLTYLQDIAALIETLALDRLVVFGTSLGGLVAMLMAMTMRDRLAGVMINDVGPELKAGGLDRIRSYVGKPTSYTTWLHAARALAGGHAHAHPGFALDDWLAMAKRLCRVSSAGRIVYDYDMRIAEPLRAPQEAAVDMWPVADALAGVPGLLLRGERSDLLSQPVAERFAARAGLELVSVLETGHAPTLEEPEAAAAIDRLLARVAG